MERIIGAAITLIDEQGADALTLRSLADRLHSSTATLYRYFESRSELIDRVVDQLFGEVELRSPSGADLTWAESLTAMATSMFETLERHGNIALLMLERIGTGPNVIRIREHVLDLLLRSGFSPVQALQAYATVGRYVLGVGAQTRIDGSIAAESDRPVLSPAEYPATVTAATAGPITLAEEFRFGLALMIVGLEAMLDDSRPPGSGPRLGRLAS